MLNVHMTPMLRRIGRYLWIVFLLGSCTADPGSIQDTGLRGQVLRGPICPVESEDPPCSDQPFSALFEIQDVENRVVARFTSDENGYFQVPLAPGRYFIVPDKSAPIINAAEVKEVSVGPYGVTEVVLHFDTGIR